PFVNHARYPRFTQNKTGTKIGPTKQEATMTKRTILTGALELTAFSLLFGAVALWSVALSPIH
uniref:hypothetical protein n=1 Tax=Klebsiella pneumoniae TaxID=573 RepID=UPI0019530117